MAGVVNVTQQDLQGFLAYGVRVTCRRGSSRWWERVVDLVWPPVVRYGRTGTFTLEVNGKAFVRTPLAVARFDRRAGALRLSFYRPIALQPHDVFSTGVTMARPGPATMQWAVLLDGFLK